MIVTVFRLRLSADPKAQEQYAELAPRIGALASKMPGFMSASARHSRGPDAHVLPSVGQRAAPSQGRRSRPAGSCAVGFRQRE
jgi:hypothetical protein